MARGWESKSVEAQQEEALAAKPEKKARSQEEIQQSRDRENLRLARARVLQQIQVSRDPRYTEMLQRTLADLERQLGSA